MVQFLSGLESALSQSQVYTLVLDGALVLLAAILLTLVPPGPAFGRAWGPTSPSQKKSHRHMIALPQRSPGLALHNSPVPSPYGYAYNTGTKEPRSPPPSVQTTGGSAAGASTGGGDVSHRSSRRYSPQQWPQTYKRQAPAPLRSEGAQLPPYERPLDYQRVPYIPPASLSQQYGQGTIVESEVEVRPAGSEGSRTGSGGNRTRTRTSPRNINDTMVSHDDVW